MAISFFACFLSLMADLFRAEISLSRARSSRLTVISAAAALFFAFFRSSVALFPISLAIAAAVALAFRILSEIAIFALLCQPNQWIISTPGPFGARFTRWEPHRGIVSTRAGRVETVTYLLLVSFSLTCKTDAPLAFRSP